MLRDWNSLDAYVREDMKIHPKIYSKIIEGKSPSTIEYDLKQGKHLIPFIRNSLHSVTTGEDFWTDMGTYEKEYFVEDREPYIVIVETHKGKYAIDIALRNSAGHLEFASFNLGSSIPSRIMKGKIFMEDWESIPKSEKPFYNWQSSPHTLGGELDKDKFRNYDWREGVDRSYFKEGIRVGDLTDFLSFLHEKLPFINWRKVNPLSIK